jgi:hypothetical protein
MIEMSQAIADRMYELRQKQDTQLLNEFQTIVQSIE